MTQYLGPIKGLLLLTALPGGVVAGFGQPAETDLPKTATLTGRVQSKVTGAPLPGARVRAAVPSTDMRLLRARPGALRYEATADQEGRYQLVLPVDAPDTIVSLDAFQPGYRSYAGRLIDGGLGSRIVLSPWQKESFVFELEPAAYVAGNILDEGDKPIADAKITAVLRTPRSRGYVTILEGDKTGEFAVFEYPVTPQEGEAGELVFEHPRYRRTVVKDVYALTEKERRELRVVLQKGRTVAGRLLRAEGDPVEGMMVEALFDDPQERKATTTDGRGRFVLAGLPDQETTLRAHAMALKQKAKRTLLLDKDYKDLDLRLSPVKLTAELKPTTLLGMKVVDVTPELKDLYDLWHKRGVLILDPGADHLRLHIGELVEGDCFWIVGEQEISGIKHLVSALLKLRREGQDGCRVVTSFKRPDFAGTNTQHMTLSDKDVKELEELLKQLEEDGK